jgi:hypothetical protein
MGTVNGQTTAMGLPKSVGAHITTPCALDARNRGIGFSVCSAGFQSCFGTILPCYFPIPPFWNGNVYCVPIYLGSM